MTNGPVRGSWVLFNGVNTFGMINWSCPVFGDHLMMAVHVTFDAAVSSSD